jgi:hypothetical protein
MENEIDWNNQEQLRAAVTQFVHGPQAAPSEPPLPPGVEPVKLTPAQRQSVSDLWVASILEKKIELWTKEERQAVLDESKRVLREL